MYSSLIHIAKVAATQKHHCCNWIFEKEHRESVSVSNNVCNKMVS